MNRHGFIGVMGAALVVVASVSPVRGDGDPCLDAVQKVTRYCADTYQAPKCHFRCRVRSAESDSTGGAAVIEAWIDGARSKYISPASTVYRDGSDEVVVIGSSRLILVRPVVDAGDNTGAAASTASIGDQLDALVAMTDSIGCRTDGSTGTLVLVFDSSADGMASFPFRRVELTYDVATGAPRVGTYEYAGTDGAVQMDVYEYLSVETEFDAAVLKSGALAAVFSHGHLRQEFDGFEVKDFRKKTQ